MQGMKGINWKEELADGVDKTDLGMARLGGVRDISLIAVGAITAGQAVALVPATNTHGYMSYVEAVDVTDTRPDLIVGGALEDAATGAEVRVRVLGIQTGVKVNTGATVGDNIGVGASDGTVTDAATNVVLTPGIILAVDSPSANIGVVWWNNRMGL